MFGSNRAEKVSAYSMTWSDEELVARSIGGDPDSFNQLVLRWERPIYALAYRVIGREEDARDVCQETFLRAFRALNGFRGQAVSPLYRSTISSRAASSPSSSSARWRSCRKTSVRQSS